MKKPIILALTAFSLCGCASLTPTPSSFSTGNLGAPVYTQTVKDQYASMWQKQNEDEKDYYSKDANDNKIVSFTEDSSGNRLCRTAEVLRYAAEHVAAIDQEAGFARSDHSWVFNQPKDYQLLVEPYSVLRGHRHMIDYNIINSRCEAGNTISRFTGGLQDSLKTNIFKTEGLTVVDVEESFSLPVCSNSNIGRVSTNCYMKKQDGFRHRFVINPATSVTIGTSFDPAITGKTVMAWIMSSPDLDVINEAGSALAGVVNGYIQNMGDRPKILRNAKNDLDICDNAAIDLNSKDSQRMERVGGNRSPAHSPIMHLQNNMVNAFSYADRQQFKRAVENDIVGTSKALSKDVLEVLRSKRGLK